MAKANPVNPAPEVKAEAAAPEVAPQAQTLEGIAAEANEAGKTVILMGNAVRVDH